MGKALAILVALATGDVLLKNNGTTVGPVSAIDCRGAATCTRSGASGLVTCGASADAGVGTVSTVSVTTANGVSGSVATATTTPAITITLGAITPSSVAASGTISGSNFSGNTTNVNTGDITLGNVGTFPQPQGAALSGQQLILEPADGTTPGVVSATDQSFGGNKTFVGTIAASNFAGSHVGASSGTNTGDQTITLTGGATGSGTGAITVTLNPATEALAPAPVVGPPLPAAKYLIPYVTAPFLPPCNAVRRTRCKETPGGIHQ